jgi:hypothetical protein
MPQSGDDAHMRERQRMPQSGDDAHMVPPHTRSTAPMYWARSRFPALVPCDLGARRDATAAGRSVIRWQSMHR